MSVCARLILLVVLLVSALGCGSTDEVFAGELTAPVVYGADDRVEVFNHPDRDLRRIAQESIAALIPSFRLSRETDGTYTLGAETLGELHDLCADELFADQLTAAFCSGVLIDDDLVLTAGHCIEAHTTCERSAFVFNYYLADPTHLATIRDEDVYRCARVVSQRSPEGRDYTPDFAVIQLDRPVEGAHAPVPIRPASPLDVQESLAMIGFGSGLPAKIDSGGWVDDRRAEQLDFFSANVDAFQGHSGAATFDSEDRLAGILIGGLAPDYVTLEGESCQRVSVYDDSVAGEIVHNIAPIVAALCEDGWDSEELCDPEACSDQPCGFFPPPPGGSGIVPGDSSGCSASISSTRFGSGWWGLLLFAAARRFRKRAA